MANLFSNNFFGPQMRDYLPLYQVGDTIRAIDLSNLLTYSIAISEIMTGVLLWRRGGFQSQSNYYQPAVPASVFEPWSPRATLGGQFGAVVTSDGSFILSSDSYNSTMYGTMAPYVTGHNTSRRTTVYNGLIQWIRYSNNSSSNLVYEVIGGFNAPAQDTFDQTHYQAGTELSVGNVKGLNLVDISSFVSDGAGYICPALFSMIYQNIRRAAITPQIFIQIPYWDESFFWYVDPLFNRTTMINNFSSLVPFETQTLAEGGYYVYLYTSASGPGGGTANMHEPDSVTLSVGNYTVPLTRKNIGIYGHLYVGRIPPTNAGNHKYTKLRLSLGCQLYSQTNHENWSSNDTQSSGSKKMMVLGWVAGYSEVLCYGI